MLEEILDTTTPNSTGTIKLVSEFDMCGSCIKAIDQFRQLRPDIKTELVFVKPYSSSL